MLRLDLVGHHPATIDSKRRIYLPTEIQKVLDAAKEYALFVGKPYRTRCISLLTSSAYQKMLQFIDNPAEYHPLDEGDRARYIRHSLASYKDERIAQGRIHLNELLLQWAQLDPKDHGTADGGVRCVIVANFDRLEIWNPDLLNEDAALEGNIPNFRGLAAQQQLLTKSRSGWPDADADVAT